MHCMLCIVVFEFYLMNYIPCKVLWVLFYTYTLHYFENVYYASQNAFIDSQIKVYGSVTKINNDRQLGLDILKLKLKD